MVCVTTKTGNPCDKERKNDEQKRVEEEVTE